jgi:DNA modification methylase
MDKVKLLHGDCLELMKDIPDGSVDLTVTSPPYDNLRTYNGNNEQWSFEKFKAIAKELYRVTKQGGVVVWIVADATIKGSETGTSFRQALHFMDCGFNLHDTMIWSKPSFTAVGALKTRYAQTFEYMFVFSKGKPKTFNPIKDRKNINAGRKKQGTIRQKDGSFRPMSNWGKQYREFGIRYNVWDMPPVMSNIERKGHPAQFPEQLANDHILSWSNEGDAVLDPFMGSGTTGKMAVLNGRNFIGIEIDAEYFEIAKRRISEAQNKPQIPRFF